jgi:hypothetical protein
MKKIISFSLLFCVIATITFFTLLYSVKDMKPENFADTHSGMNKMMADSLIVKITKGLSIYQQKHGRYPITDSKYYLDSIIEFAQINPVYVYHDTMIDGRIDCRRINSNTTNTYIGVGNCTYIIKYSCFDGLVYKLFYTPPTGTMSF